MSERMRERVNEATEVTYTRGQVNRGHSTQGEIVKSSMFWKLNKDQ